MRAVTIVGIVLIVIGVVALAYQGITYTTREKVLEVGPVEVQRETQKTIPLPPIVGGVALAGGIILVLMGARRGENEANRTVQYKTAPWRGLFCGLLPSLGFFAQPPKKVYSRVNTV